MNLHDAEELAEKIMREWLTPSWTFEWTRTKRVLGRCTYETRTIALSRSRTQTRTPAQVEEVIRHEVAHAMAGPDAGHGSTWKYWARVLGANPCRVNSDPDGEGEFEQVYKWVATCSACGKKSGQHRWTNYLKNGTACGDCCRAHAGGKFDERFMLTFVQQW